ncbi:hypothetical protein ACFW9B_31980, partial [Streptomyces yangpuensis]
MTHETYDTDEKKDPMLLVPLYEHPADRPEAWERLIRSADRLHSVVLNPDSGPRGGRAPGGAPPPPGRPGGAPPPP